MDTKFLANILLVAETGSIAEAARQLDITPGAIAQQIQALERELEVDLFKRVGRSVVPTTAGYRVLVQAKELTKGVALLKSVALTNEFKGELRIGAITTALLSIVPDIFAAFTTKFPEVRVIIKAGTSLELYESLHKAELDLVICLHPNFALSKSYQWQLLREEPLVVLAPCELSAKHPYHLLANLPFIRYDRSLGGGKQADNYLREVGIIPHELVELNSLAAITMMVERNLGVSLVPDISSPLIDKLKVTKISLPNKTESRRFGLIWNRASPRYHLIEQLKNIAISTIV